MLRERLRLAAAVGIQLAILAVVPLRPLLAERRGREVTLATAPVDPFDPFTGAFVRLAYEVERLPPGDDAPGPAEGATVFLLVVPGRPAWTLSRLAESLEEAGPGELALRARWHRGRPHLENAGRLYLPSEEAREADLAVQALRGTGEPPPLVDLRVDADGNVRLLRLRVGDRVFGR